MKRKLAVIALLLMFVAGPGVTTAVAQDDSEVTVDRECEGGFFETKQCELVNGVIGAALSAIKGFVGGIMEAVVDMIVGAPVPMADGERAVFERPTNQPWQAIYDSWLSQAVPIALLEWLLLVFGVLFSEVFISNTESELKRRELKHRVWKVFLAILASWGIGATILHISDAVATTVGPSSEQMTNNLFTFITTAQTVGMAALLTWYISATVFLFLVILILARLAVIFTMMWALPVLLPLAAINVGPLKVISRPVRGIIDLFIPFVFMTLPIALVLRVGYVVLNALNSDLVAGAAFSFSGADVGVLLGFWIVAALSPLFVFRKTGMIAGFAAMLGAASINKGARESLSTQEGQEHSTPPRYDSGPEVHDPYEHLRNSDTGTFGGGLPSGDTNQPSMITAGSQADSPALPASSDGGGTPGDIFHVRRPNELPTDTKFNVGRIKEDGAFQPLHGDPNFTRSGVLDNYNKIATSGQYQDENLVVQSQDDGSFFDLDSMTHREQSYERMSRDSSNDVLNS